MTAVANAFASLAAAFGLPDFALSARTLLCATGSASILPSSDLGERFSRSRVFTVWATSVVVTRRAPVCTVRAGPLDSRGSGSADRAPARVETGETTSPAQAGHVSLAS